MTKNCVYNCLKDKCPLWVVLTTTYDDKEGKKQNTLEGKCSFAWIPTLLVELKQKIGNGNI